MGSRTAFITTPIFYANAEPHLGHAYTLCMADAWSRFAAIRRHPSLQAFPSRRVPMRPIPFRNSFLCTGVDEHGSKIARSALSLRCTPKHLCDHIAMTFKELAESLHISTSVFIRTTDSVHKNTVVEAWRSLERSKHLYWSTFSGWYSTADEAFYADWEVEDSTSSAGIKVAKSSGNEVHWVEEETCRFRLLDFKAQLHTWLDSGVLPSESSEHSRLLALTHSCLDLLEDPSLSRPRDRVPWGIPVPGRPDQTIYVWFDALMSYLTAGGVCLNSGKSEQCIWPPDCQFVGKDILRFHAILWPALLLALGLPLPKKIIPHAHILVDGRKMSKSLGNVMSPWRVLEHFSKAFTPSPVAFTEAEARALAADCLRYCLVRSVCLNEDTIFRLPLATETVNTELVNWLGNLLSRITSEKIVPFQRVPILDLAEAEAFMSDPADAAFFNDLKHLPTTVDVFWWERLQPNCAMDALMHVVRQTNAFVDRHRPWKSPAGGKEGSATAAVVAIALEALRLVGCFLTPLTPSISDRLFNNLGIRSDTLRCSSWHLNLGSRHQLPPLVPRIKV